MKIVIVDCFENSSDLECHQWTSVKDIKDALQDIFGIPSSHMRLFFAGHELRNHRTLDDCDVCDGSTLLLMTSQSAVTGRELLQVYGGAPCSSEFKQKFAEIRQGIGHGLMPKLTDEGTGGCYFLRNAKKLTVAVFKPEDEEPFAPNNPRGYVGVLGQPGFRHGVRSGEGNLREVAAYLMDHGHFAGVPPTTRVEMDRSAFYRSRSKPAVDPLQPAFDSEPSDAPKVGALQTFIDYDDVAGNLSADVFPTEEVQKIAILDIRLINSDRNEANILVKRVKKETVEKEKKKEKQDKLDKEKSKSQKKLKPKKRKEKKGESKIDESVDEGPQGSQAKKKLKRKKLKIDVIQEIKPKLKETKDKPDKIVENSKYNDFDDPENNFNGGDDDEDDYKEGKRRRRYSSLCKQEIEEYTHRLIPIDHSYCLPDKLEIMWADWVWYDWPQIKQPLSENMKSYIAKLDIMGDIKLLRTTLAIREPCLRLMRITDMVLKSAVAAGFTLFDVASLICRADIDTPSALEVLCAQASAMVGSLEQNVRLKEFTFNHPQERYSAPSLMPSSNNRPLGLTRSISLQDIHVNVCKDGFGPLSSSRVPQEPKTPRDKRVVRSQADKFELFFTSLTKLVDSTIDRWRLRRIQQQQIAKFSDSAATEEPYSPLGRSNSSPGSSPSRPITAHMTPPLSSSPLSPATEPLSRKDQPRSLQVIDQLESDDENREDDELDSEYLSMKLKLGKMKAGEPDVETDEEDASASLAGAKSQQKPMPWIPKSSLSAPRRSGGACGQSKGRVESMFGMHRAV